MMWPSDKYSKRIKGLVRGFTRVHQGPLWSTRVHLVPSERYPLKNSSAYPPSTKSIQEFYCSIAACLLLPYLIFTGFSKDTRHLVSRPYKSKEIRGDLKGLDKEWRCSSSRKSRSNIFPKFQTVPDYPCNGNVSVSYQLLRVTWFSLELNQPDFNHIVYHATILKDVYNMWHLGA